MADRLIVTRVHMSPPGDTRLPPIDAAIWREVERSERPAGPDDAAGFTLMVYERAASRLSSHPS
jgi:dihydrofolate reductase